MIPSPLASIYRCLNRHGLIELRRRGKRTIPEQLGEVRHVRKLATGLAVVLAYIEGGPDEQGAMIAASEIIARYAKAIDRGLNRLPVPRVVSGFISESRDTRVNYACFVEERSGANASWPKGPTGWGWGRSGRYRP